jgi:hypothetical protein
MKDTDLAYIAGLVDGEGYIGFLKKKVQGWNPNHRIRVVITNTDVGIVRWLFDSIPGSTVFFQDHCRKKRIYRWNIQGTKAYEFLRVILPYLRIKKAQAELAIRFIETRTLYVFDKTGRKWGEKRIPETEIAMRENLYLEMKKLNSGTKIYS